MIDYCNFEKIPAIYILHVRDSFYIGSTKNLRKRIIEHKNDLRRKCHRNSRLQNLVNELSSSEKIMVEVIPVPADINKEELLEQEDVLISTFLGNSNLLNFAVGNNVLANRSEEEILAYKKERSKIWHRMSKTNKEKIKQAQKEWWDSLSEEERENRSKRASVSAKSFWESLTPEQQQERTDYAVSKRKPLSKEDRAKISERLRVRHANTSKEDRAKISKNQSIGIKKHWAELSEEERERRREVNSAARKKWSTNLTEEERRVIGDKSKKNWAALPEEEKNRRRAHLAREAKKRGASMTSEQRETYAKRFRENNPKTRAIVVDGVEWPSARAYAKETNMSPSNVCLKLKSDKHPNYQYKDEQ